MSSAAGVLRRGRTTPGDAVLGRLLVAAVALGYLVPLTVESFVHPKGFRPITDAPPAPDPTLELVTLLGNALMLAACAGVVLLRLGRVRRLLGPVLALLAAWAVGVAGLLAAGSSVSRGVVIFPAVCAAVAVLRAGGAIVRALGWTVLALVAVSVVMAVATPDAGLYFLEANQRDEKFVWDHGILVGPYRTGNNLGLVLAVGLPFVLALPGRALRVAGTAVTALALAWTFSRTSIGAAVVGVAVAAVLAGLPRLTGARGGGLHRPGALGAPHPSSALGGLHPSSALGGQGAAGTARLRGALAAAGLAVLGLAVLALPVVTRDPTSFNNRAGFWHEGLEAWRQRPLLGWGADYYARLARSEENLGGFAYHAHNEAVQLLVTGGVVLLGLVLAAVVVASVTAVRLAAAGVVWPAAFLAAFLVSAAVEVPLGVVDRGMFYPAVLVPLCLLLTQGRDLLPALPDREGPPPA